MLAGIRSSDNKVNAVVPVGLYLPISVSVAVVIVLTAILVYLKRKKKRKMKALLFLLFPAFVILYCYLPATDEVL